MLEALTLPGTWIAFLTLTALEVVLGIDNIIFISILVGRLPRERQRAARNTGLALAMLTRIALLASVVWLTRLTQPWFGLAGRQFSARDLVLLLGGLFLLGKSVLEIDHTLKGAAGTQPRQALTGFLAVVLQIAVIDIVFSLDSVFTAVGLLRPDQVPIMVAAIIVSILAMMVVSGSIGAFIDRNPTLKILALAFLILVGMALIASAFQFEIPKGYLYFAMAFSVGVEMLNLRLRRLLDARRQARQRQSGEPPGG